MFLNSSLKKRQRNLKLSTPSIKLPNILGTRQVEIRSLTKLYAHPISTSTSEMSKSTSILSNNKLPLKKSGALSIKAHSFRWKKSCMSKDVSASRCYRNFVDNCILRSKLLDCLFMFLICIWAIRFYFGRWKCWHLLA